MLLKPIAIAAALTTFGAASVYAQTTTQTPSTTAPAAPMAKTDANANFSADTRKLIGRNIQNRQNETIGEIEAIYLGKDGKVDSVVVGVGGFLGIGEREVMVPWKDLNVMNNGEKVTVNMTKDQLKAMPAYKYKDATYRGQMFNETGIYRDGNRAGMDNARAPMKNGVNTGMNNGRTDNNQAVATHDVNADGNMSTDAIVGANVRNSNNETIGEIVDTYVDKNGQIQQVVVSVGGFLGMGTRHVAVKWSDIQVRRDGNGLAVTTNWTKESLKAMPEYKYDRYQAQAK